MRGTTEAVLARRVEHLRRYSGLRAGDWVLLVGEKTGAAALMAGVARALGARACVIGAPPANVPPDLQAAQFVRAAPERTGFPDDRFGAAVVDGVRELSDPAAVFSEMRRVLRPGGRLFVFTRSPDQLRRNFWHARFPDAPAADVAGLRDVPEVAALLEVAGFERVRREDYISFEPVRRDQLVALARGGLLPELRGVPREALEAGARRIEREEDLPESIEWHQSVMLRAIAPGMEETAEGEP